MTVVSHYNPLAVTAFLRSRTRPTELTHSDSPRAPSQNNKQGINFALTSKNATERESILMIMSYHGGLIALGGR